MRGRKDEEVTAFVRARYGHLLRTAYLLCGDREKAEDLVQTTLAKTVVAWSRLQRSEGIDHYVERVLVNTFVSSRRRRSWWEQPPGPAGGEPDAGSVRGGGTAGLAASGAGRITGTAARSGRPALLRGPVGA